MKIDAWPDTNGSDCRWTISYPGQPTALHLVIKGLKPLTTYRLQTNGLNNATMRTDVTGSLSGDYSGAASAPVTLGLISLPLVNPPALVGNSLILTGTSATPGESYKLLASTNVATPLSLWTTDSSGFFDGTGAFSNRILITPSEQSRFFQLKTP